MNVMTMNQNYKTMIKYYIILIVFFTDFNYCHDANVILKKTWILQYFIQSRQKSAYYEYKVKN